MSDILNKILDTKQAEVAAAMAQKPLPQMHEEALAAAPAASCTRAAAAPRAETDRPSDCVRS